MTYLDYNATAPMRPEVKAAMVEVIDGALNPSSIHAAGRGARKLVEEARRQVLAAVNADNLIFCGSGTEANNLALRQIEMSDAGCQMSGVVISAIEHDSIFKAAPNAKIIRVDENGIIDLNHLKEILTSDIRYLVSIMLANNETGIIQPVAEAAEIAREHGALVHCDAVQGFGKMPLDFKELGVDMMTISCHKIGGPVGAAALMVREGLEIKPLMFGGGQEKNKRPGTENVAAIVGFGEVNKNVSRETLASHKSKFISHRDYLEAEIKKLGGVVIGEGAERLPNTSCIAMPGVEAAVQVIHFDTNGICISAGSACSSGRVEVSRVLLAMNTPLAKNAIRVSTGWGTTGEEIDKFIAQWRQLYFGGRAARS